MSTLQNFTDSDAQKFEQKAKNEPYFKSFRNYRNRLDIVYLIPDFKNLHTPQWSHVKEILNTEAGTYLLIGIFNDSDYLWSIETALKYPLIDINNAAFNNGNRTFHGLIK